MILPRHRSSSLIIDRRASMLEDVKKGRLELLKRSVSITAEQSRDRDKSSLGNQALNTATDVGTTSTRLNRYLHNLRSAREASATGKAARTARKLAKARRVGSGARRAASSTKKSVGFFRAAGQAIKSTITALSGSVAGIIVLVIVVGVIIIAVVGSIVSMIPTISLKSEDWELTKTHTYITELDLEVQEEIDKAEDNHPGYDEYHYFINGAAIAKSSIFIQTDTDLFLAYLDTKYDDYTLDGVLRIFGTKVRNEITKIHNVLYTVDYVPKEIVVEKEDDPEPEPNPDPPKPPPGPQPPIEFLSAGGNKETLTILEIRLKAVPLKDYLGQNRLLTEDQAERLELLQSLGTYTTRQELADPFPGHPWTANISSRFGWRFHPITGEKQLHQGLDIAMPQGAPIAASISGTVVSVRNDSIYGNMVEIESISGDKTVLYAHCSRVEVRKGQTVARGEIIAYVGNTGQSTGNHLHIEFSKKGRKLNPAFYLKGGGGQ